MKTLRFSLFVLLIFHSMATLAQNLEVITPKQKTVLSLADIKVKLKSQTIKIEDPVYGKSKEFDAFVLQDVLHLAGAAPEEHADELIFTAADGYAPNVTFDKLKTHKAYLAYQDHQTPGRFELVNQGKATLSPWPFYLVWEEGTKLKDEVPWPYQLVKLEVVDWLAKYPKVVPKRAAVDSKEMKGFALFKAECIRCHSINLEGGDVGPELNVPQSVTEYWKSDALNGFIHHVADYRAKSKMPDFSRLSDEQIGQVVAYLRAMANAKIKLP